MIEAYCGGLLIFFIVAARMKLLTIMTGNVFVKLAGKYYFLCRRYRWSHQILELGRNVNSGVEGNSYVAILYTLCSD